MSLHEVSYNPWSRKSKNYLSFDWVCFKRYEKAIPMKLMPGGFPLLTEGNGYDQKNEPTILFPSGILSFFRVSGGGGGGGGASQVSEL